MEARLVKPVHSLRSPVRDVLATAIELHRAGRQEPAARLYEKILRRDQDHIKATHMLGLLHHQRGNHGPAIELISRAVALLPNAVVSHTNLAEAYRGAGQFYRAIGCCRLALVLSPDHPEALCNLGASLQGLGQHFEAVEHFRRALELRPEFVVAHNNLGIALYELEQTDEAIEHFRRAIELQPTFVPALTNLAEALVYRGLSAEALPHCQEAVRLEPDTALLHLSLGNVLKVLDRKVDARVAYLEALRLDPNLASAYARLALCLQNEAKLSEAVPWLKKAAELEPTNIELWESLGRLYDEMDESGEAIPCWRQVLALMDEEQAGPHIALGRALRDEGQLGEAEDHFRTAMALQPDAPMAHMNLAGLYEELGHMTEAEALLRTALEIQPNFPLPHAKLATLLRGKLPDGDLAALERRLADEKLDRGPRARLLFGLAHVLDARGDFARAAECLHEANATALLLDHKRDGYDPGENRQHVDVLLEQFNLDFFAQLKDAGSDSRRPIFIMGLPRSGTTLTEQVLASHSQIHGAGELRLARQSFEAMPAILQRIAPPRECLAHLDGPAVEQIAQKHLEGLAALDGGNCARIVDKMPDNYMNLGLLAVLFPRAVFIHCRRDLRDIAVSCWMTDFGKIRWANDRQHIVTRIQQYRRVMDHWQKVLPVPLIEVNYEETVDDLERIARRLLTACELDWEPACLEFYRNERPVRTASITQVRQPVYKTSVARWKNYEPALSELFAQLPVEAPMVNDSSASVLQHGLALSGGV